MLSGRLALVTGGGRGIGRAVSQVLSREGARIVAADLDQDAANETIKNLEGSDHMALIANVGCMKSINEAKDKIVSAYGQPPSVVVNSAGITRDGYMLKMSEEDFDKVIEVNLKGTFNVNKVFAAAMKEAKTEEGSFVNIASIVGQTGNAGQVNYAASKAGVIAFTKSAAKELGKFGIRVNCIAPGFIETPMTDTIPDHFKQMLLMQIPLATFGDPEDIAEVAAFLSSNRAKYVNGSIINVNGGLL